jgi:hypothetical protein
MSRTPHTRRSNPRRSAGLRVTRRQLLMGLGGMAAAGAACTVTGVGGALVLAVLANNAPRVSVLPTHAVMPSAAPTAVLPTPVPPPLITKPEWGGLPPNHEAENERGFYSPDNMEGWYTYTVPLADAYQTLVLHHSVIYYGNDLATARGIQTLHRGEERSWADIGYHYLVGRSGGIYEARPLNVRGIHVAGHNTGSVGVCLMGNFVNESLTDEQRASTLLICQWLTLVLPNMTHLAGHNEFNPETLCPGENLIPFLDEAATWLGLQRGVAGYRPPADDTAVPPAES